MDHYAIRDPRNGKYCKGGERDAHGRHDEPHHLFYGKGGTKSSISQKKRYGRDPAEEYEIVPVEVTVDEDNIETYG